MFEDQSAATFVARQHGRNKTGRVIAIEGMHQTLMPERISSSSDRRSVEFQNLPAVTAPEQINLMAIAATHDTNRIVKAPTPVAQEAFQIVAIY